MKLVAAIITTALLLISAIIYAQPKVDCSVYPDQQSSPYLLPYEVGQAFNVVVSAGHYRASNNGVGLYAVDFDMPIGTKIVVVSHIVPLRFLGRTSVIQSCLLLVCLKAKPDVGACANYYLP